MASITKRTARGKTVYGVRVRRKGQSLLTATFERLTDARQWAQRMEAAVSENRAAPGNAARKYTVSDLIERYLDTIMPNKRPSTAVNQRHQLAWWRDRIGHKLLADVTPAVIAQQRDKLAKDHASATVVRYIAVMSHAFNIATKEWQWVEYSPFRRVSTPKEPRGRVRFLNDEERTRLLDACKASSSPYLYPIVLTALSTGARKGELLGLCWSDVDLHRGRITIHDTKNDERRGVPLTGPALDQMREYAKVRRIDTDMVFPSKRGDTPVEIKRAWYTALKHAGVEDFRFHDLRHSAASYLAMNGASLSDISEILGDF